MFWLWVTWKMMKMLTEMYTKDEELAYKTRLWAWVPSAWRDFPGGAVVKETTCQFRGHRFKPWSGKTPRDAEQLSPCAQLLSLRSRAHKPQVLRPCVTTSEVRAPRARALQQEKPPQWEARTL